MDNIIGEAQEDSTHLARVGIFRKVLFSALFLGAVGIAVFTFWSSKKADLAKENAKLSELILEFDQQPGPLSQESLSKLSTGISKASREFAPFAQLNLAGLSLREKNYPKAVEALSQIVAEKNCALELSQYAKIMLVSIAIDHDNIVDSAAVQEYLKEIDLPNMPFVGNAKIVKSLYLIKVDRNDDASQVLSSIINSKNFSSVIKVQAAAIADSIDLQK